MPYFARLVVLLFVLLALTTSGVHAQQATVTTVYDFPALNSKYENAAGSYPSGNVVLGSDGSLYCTASGGPHGNGTVIQITPSKDLIVLHGFSALNNKGTNMDGSNPAGELIMGSDGNLYGSTGEGGIEGGGVIFAITTTGEYSVLHHFFPNSNGPNYNTGGSVPVSGVIQASDGSLYGTTLVGGVTHFNGGTQSGGGVDFRITLGGPFVVLHEFNFITDGAGMYGGLVQARNLSFYGMTDSGGTNATGTIYRLTPNRTIDILHDFSAEDANGENEDGVGSYDDLIQASSGVLYGTSGGGALGYGTVFGITLSGNLTTLHSFSSTEGKPASSVIESNGAFFGTTRYGGATTPGSIYKVTAGGKFTILHTFDGSDGSNPIGPLTEAGDGSFYGTTSSGGVNNTGTVYRMVLN